ALHSRVQYVVRNTNKLYVMTLRQVIGGGRRAPAMSVRPPEESVALCWLCQPCGTGTQLAHHIQCSHRAEYASAGAYPQRRARAASLAHPSSRRRAPQGK